MPKKPNKTPSRNRPPAPRSALSRKQETALLAAYEAIGHAVDQLTALKMPTREFSVAFTHLETSEMWFSRAFEAMGYEPEDEDEPDEDEDEPEEDDDGYNGENQEEPPT